MILSQSKFQIRITPKPHHIFKNNFHTSFSHKSNFHPQFKFFNYPALCLLKVECFRSRAPGTPPRSYIDFSCSFPNNFCEKIVSLSENCGNNLKLNQALENIHYTDTEINNNSNTGINGDFLRPNVSIPRFRLF